MGNEADRIMAADMRPLMSQLTCSAHPHTLTPESLLLGTSLGIVGDITMTHYAIKLLVTLTFGLLVAPRFRSTSFLCRLRATKTLIRSAAIRSEAP
jgi:hypothetical protein